MQKFSRRTLLKTGAVGGIAALSGCLGSDDEELAQDLKEHISIVDYHIDEESYWVDVRSTVEETPRYRVWFKFKSDDGVVLYESQNKHGPVDESAQRVTGDVEDPLAGLSVIELHINVRERGFLNIIGHDEKADSVEVDVEM